MEIKFRQRNKNNGSFHYWGDINENAFLHPKCQDNYVDPRESEQFTTQKDINGKEIYTGDIIKGFIDGKEIVSQVFFDEGCFSVMVEKDYWPCLYEVMKKEIIGSIHTNPELLK